MLSTSPQIRVSLTDNVKILRTTLAKLEDVSIYIPSDPVSALVHIYMKNPPEDIEHEEKLLQDVVDEALAQGVLITRSARLRGQENEMTPTLKIMVSAAFTKKEMEKASTVLKSAITKHFGSKYTGSIYGRAMELMR
jgi:serine palmitoyltransferase